MLIKAVYYLYTYGIYGYIYLYVNQSKTWNTRHLVKTGCSRLIHFSDVGRPTCLWSLLRLSQLSSGSCEICPHGDSSGLSLVRVFFCLRLLWGINSKCPSCLILQLEIRFKTSGCLQLDLDMFLSAMKWLADVLGCFTTIEIFFWCSPRAAREHSFITENDGPKTTFDLA